MTSDLITPSELAKQHHVSRQTVSRLLSLHPERETKGRKITDRLTLYPADMLDGYLPSPRHQQAGKVPKTQEKHKRKKKRP